MSSAIGNMCRKRLVGELRLIKKEPNEYVDVSPDPNDILTWYFLIKGPDASHYKNGYYIGKIMLTSEYPSKPPDFMMLTPSGRFIPDNKICMSNTGYHSDEWSAMWNIGAILTGFLSIMLDDHEHGISHIKRSLQERQELAAKSVEFNKRHYPDVIKLFTRFLDENGDPIEQEVPTPMPEPVPTPVPVIEPIIMPEPVPEPIIVPEPVPEPELEFELEPEFEPDFESDFESDDEPNPVTENNDPEPEPVQPVENNDQEPEPVQPVENNDPEPEPVQPVENNDPEPEPATKPVAKKRAPRAKATDKPDAKPRAKPVAKPRAKPVAKPGDKPVAKPRAKPAPRTKKQPVKIVDDQTDANNMPPVKKRTPAVKRAKKQPVTSTSTSTLDNNNNQTNLTINNFNPNNLPINNYDHTDKQYNNIINSKIISVATDN